MMKAKIKISTRRLFFGGGEVEVEVEANTLEEVKELLNYLTSSELKLS